MTTEINSMPRKCLSGSAVRLAFGTALAAILLPAAPLAARRSFDTPLAAIQSVIDAAGNNDSAAFVALFGPDGKDIFESGDPAQDKDMRAEFVAAAREKLQVEDDPSNPDRITFTVGDQQWPFPVPIVRTAGKWRLDSSGGRLEMLARRIGRNELNTMEICRGYAETQLEYASAARDGNVLEYAQRIAASPGKQDGLYSEDPARSLVPREFAAAAGAGAGKAEPYHGYFFRVLKSQGPAATGGALSYVVNGRMIGGFALVAWPAEYGVSGIQTFLISHEGVLYGKDLGPNTAALARQMAAFNPGPAWHQIVLE